MAAAFFRAAAARPRPAWSPEECAVYDARRDFELLKHLSRDKQAFATARRLGFVASHIASGAVPAHGAAASAAGRASAGQQTPAAAAGGGGAARRRSAKRSAKRHRRRRLRCSILCVLFVLRLRRAVVATRAAAARAAGGAPTLQKRAASRPASAASSSSEGSLVSSDPGLASGLVAAPGVVWAAPGRRQRVDGWQSGFLLR